MVDRVFMPGGIEERDLFDLIDTTHAHTSRDTAVIAAILIISIIIAALVAMWP